MRDELGRLLERELDEGERVVWTGHPDPKRYARRVLPTVILSIAILGFFTIIFGLVGIQNHHLDMQFENGADDTPSYWAYAVKQTAFYVMIALLAAWQLLWIAVPYVRSNARRTLYALTDRCAIVLRSLRVGGVTERDYDRAELIHLRRVERADGTGDLFFEGARGAAASRQTTTDHGFFAIDNVLEIERMVRAFTREGAA